MSTGGVGDSYGSVFNVLRRRCEYSVTSGWFGISYFVVCIYQFTLFHASMSFTTVSFEGTTLSIYVLTTRGSRGCSYRCIDSVSMYVS